MQRCYIQIVFRRIIWIVLDSVGIGEMPDAAAYGDAGSDTLGNIAQPPAAAPAQPVPPGPRQHQAAGGTAARRRACRIVRPLRAGLARQGHHHRPLGDGRHPSRKAFPAFPARISRAKSWTNSSAASRAARWATRPPRAPKSSRSWARSTCAPARRSSTLRPTACSRWPRTRKSSRCGSCTRSAKPRASCCADRMKWAA